MITRRKFFKASLLGVAAAGILPIESFSQSGKNKLKNIGFISNMLKNELVDGDWRELLKKTVDMGYTEFEGGILGDSPDAFKAYCKQIGLKHIAGGIGMTDDMDKAKAKLDELSALGVKYAVNYWPWFGGAPFKLEDCKKSAPILNQIGELAKERGLVYCWHNHDNEFIAMENGQFPFDYLMENTDKNLVKVELDIFWVAKGNADPVAVMKQYPGMVKILHVKDMTGDAERTFECPGSGIIDFPAVFAEAKKQGIRHYFVERDQVVDGLGCLASSAQYLKALRF
jgi:sugar phosphate isomerase/epimerase